MSIADELIGKTFIAPVCSQVGRGGVLRLAVSTTLYISGLRSEFVIHKNDALWHQTKDAADALTAYFKEAEGMSA